MHNIIEVRSEKQIAEVTDLAEEIWREHYTPIIGREQVDYMLEKFQSEKAISEQIAGTYEYFMLVHNDESAGYLAIVPDLQNGSFLLSKIYVKKSLRGHGLGRKMLEFTEDLCRNRQIKNIWLTVNKNNTDSISWYSRMGFKNTGPTVQDIGGGFVMDDFRMEKIIG